VLHTPIMNIEELKFDLVHQLNEMNKKEHVIVIIDSIGNLASKKELDDALAESGKADMTRAKALKGLFRMITPYLQMKDIPLFAVNHTYKTQDMFPTDVVSGGTGPMYSSNAVWIIGRRQEKKGTEIQGYHFIIKIEKSRMVKEKSKIPISVSWEGGILKWSGLFEIAVEAGYIAKALNDEGKEKKGWYTRLDKPKGDPVGKAVREVHTQTAEFWKPLLTDAVFVEWIKEKYTVGEVTMIDEGEM
jgi:hypothetical protein